SGAEEALRCRMTVWQARVARTGSLLRRVGYSEPRKLLRREPPVAHVPSRTNGNSFLQRRRRGQSRYADIALTARTLNNGLRNHAVGLARSRAGDLRRADAAGAGVREDYRPRCNTILPVVTSTESVITVMCSVTQAEVTESTSSSAAGSSQMHTEASRPLPMS